MNVYADLLARAMYDPGDQGFRVQVFEGDPTNKRDVVKFLRYKVHDHGFYSWFPKNVQVSGPIEGSTSLHVYRQHKLLSGSAWSFPIEDLLAALEPVDVVDPGLAAAERPAAVTSPSGGRVRDTSSTSPREHEDGIARAQDTPATALEELHQLSFDVLTSTPEKVAVGCDVPGASGRELASTPSSPYEASGLPETVVYRRKAGA